MAGELIQWVQKSNCMVLHSIVASVTPLSNQDQGPRGCAVSVKLIGLDCNCDS